MRLRRNKIERISRCVIDGGAILDPVQDHLLIGRHGVTWGWSGKKPSSDRTDRRMYREWLHFQFFSGDDCRLKPEDSKVRKGDNSRELLLGLVGDHDVFTRSGKGADTGKSQLDRRLRRLLVMSRKNYLKDELPLLGLYHPPHIG